METNTSVKISIPNLCHEDWNKMTPNEQGAFCGKCCKTVIDFTNKSPEEIKTTLLESSSSKICGRFKSTQLHESSSQSALPVYSKPPRNINYVNTFAIALFLAFGSALFSCGSYNNDAMGKIEAIQTPTDSQTKTCTPLMGEPAIEELKQGEIAIMPDTISTVKKDTINDEPVKMGKIKVSK